MLTLLPNELARRDAGAIVFSDAPLRVAIGPISARCADQHEIRATVHCTIAIRANSPDRQAFAELLMRDRPSVTKQDVIDYLAAAAHDAVVVGCDVPAEELLTEDARNVALERVRRAMDAAAFEAGLVLLPPIRLEMDSPSLQAERQVQAERTRASDRAAEQLAHVRHATEVLTEFETLQRSSPNARAGQLLEQIAPADRPAVLMATLAARAASVPVPTIIAVAGNVLLTLPPAQASTPQPSPLLTPISEALGPLRSVRSAMLNGQPHLLIGARSGVWLIDANKPTDARPFHDRGLQSSLGFNAAVLSNDGQLYATHADGGLVRWSLDQSDAPAETIRPSQSMGTGAKLLQTFNDSIAFANGSNIELFRHGVRQQITGTSPRPIVAMFASESRLLIVHEDGAVGQLDREATRAQPISSVAGPVSGAAALPWINGVRVLLPRDSGLIECVGLDDSVVHRYHAPYGGAPRAIVGDSALIVAISNDRQRLLAWNPGEGRSAKIDLNVATLARHRLADVAVVPAIA